MNLSPNWIVVLAATGAAVGFHLLFALLLREVPVYRERFAAAVSRQLARAHLYVDPGRLLRLNIGAATVVTLFVLAVSRSLLAAAAAAALCGVLPRAVLAFIRRRRQSAFRQQLSDLMLLTAGGLRAGSSLAQALEQTAAEIDVPARQEIGLMLREQRLGASFDDALAGLERRMPLEETALFAAALRISRETGGNLAETLESLGDAMRRKIAIEGKIRALTAQGRLQGWAMGLLPLVAAALLALVEPEATLALVRTRYGLATCAGIATMQLIGLVFVRRVMRIDV